MSDLPESLAQDPATCQPPPPCKHMARVPLAAFDSWAAVACTERNALAHCELSGVTPLELPVNLERGHHRQLAVRLQGASRSASPRVSHAPPRAPAVGPLESHLLPVNALV